MAACATTTITVQTCRYVICVKMALLPDIYVGIAKRELWYTIVQHVIATRWSSYFSEQWQVRRQLGLELSVKLRNDMDQGPVSRNSR